MQLTFQMEGHQHVPLSQGTGIVQSLCPAPDSQLYLSLHRLCPGEGDAERNAYIPRGGHSPPVPGAPWGPLAGARLSILLHLPQSGRAGGWEVGQKVLSGSGSQDPWDPISVVLISFLLFYLVYVTTAFSVSSDGCSAH